MIRGSARILRAVLRILRSAVCKLANKRKKCRRESPTLRAECALYPEKNSLTGLVAEALQRFSTSPISRASRPASTAILKARAIRFGFDAIAIAVLTKTASAPISIASAA